jgi:chaperonin GroEL
MKSRKDAYDDAIAATKAASEEGIVPGGGLALLRAIPAVEAAAAKEDGDFRTGMLILRNALESPARTIAHNSGVDGGVVVNAMRQSQGAEGYDASCGKYVDLMAAGIIDPTKVVRVALENAVSVASLLLLTEATMVEVKDPSEQKHLPGEGM